MYVYVNFFAVFYLMLYIFNHIYDLSVAIRTTGAAKKAKSKTLPSADMDAGHSRDSCSVLECSGSLRIF